MAFTPLLFGSLILTAMRRKSPVRADYFVTFTSLLIYFVTYLLRNLAADFAARIGLGVHVDIELAACKVGGLCVGQRSAAFGRARRCAGNGNLNAGILAGL